MQTDSYLKRIIVSTVNIAVKNQFSNDELARYLDKLIKDNVYEVYKRYMNKTLKPKELNDEEAFVDSLAATLYLVDDMNKTKTNKKELERNAHEIMFENPNIFETILKTYTEISPF